MEKCVRYYPTEDDMKRALGMAHISTATMEKLLASDHWEIWYGLPEEYKFELAKTRDSSATFKVEICRESTGTEKEGTRKKNDDESRRSKIVTHYIWLDPGVMQMVEKNPNVLLLAFGWRTKDQIHFTSVISGRGTTLPAAIDHVRELNNGIFNRTYKELHLEDTKKKPDKKAGTEDKN